MPARSRGITRGRTHMLFGWIREDGISEGDNMAAKSRGISRGRTHSLSDWNREDLVSEG